ncbi:WUSCHEL-related homeobox 9-like isoform X1 [Salvia hispanica]|uniref:WUSCHEL-related homeobox 9-like isoform X1 n=1 Tax=Salvia hispanica TaxID=49212 RepID=UPI002009C51D|nr:WUSCHEL-related homeobox 9-like isoform X1 [Salvia hispanica]
MSSSNRHWPSLFKSKPTSNSSPNQSHHDHHHLTRNPYTQDEERSPEPKPRWNPRPEQIRILEGIFNSGTVNPPRDEIRRIRAQLQEFGNVGDANVFYWFQNRKSRSKHKLRHLQTAKPRPCRSSSSSSDKSAPSCCNSSEKPLPLSNSTFIDLLNSPTASVNQPFLPGPSQFVPEPLVFSGQEGSAHGICFPDLSPNVGDCSDTLLDGLMPVGHGHTRKEGDQKSKLGYAVEPAVADLSAPCPISQGLVEPTPPKSMVFINDVCFDVAAGVPFNVRETFGNDVVLIQALGQPVPTDEWGVTQQPLQHGGFYYLLRSPAQPPDHRTIDLI